MKMKIKMLTRVLILFCISLLSWNTGNSCPHSDQHLIYNIHPSIIRDSSDSGRILPPQGEICIQGNNVISSSCRTNVQVRRNGGSILTCKIAPARNGRIRNRNYVSAFRNLLDRFPSGLAESSHHLIYLGKLII